MHLAFNLCEKFFSSIFALINRGGQVFHHPSIVIIQILLAALFLQDIFFHLFFYSFSEI